MIASTIQLVQSCGNSFEKPIRWKLWMIYAKLGTTAFHGGTQKRTQKISDTRCITNLYRLWRVPRCETVLVLAWRTWWRREPHFHSVSNDTGSMAILVLNLPFTVRL